MGPTPVLAAEEYIEQAYFFRVLRDRLAEGRPAQEVLDHVSLELLASTKMPTATEFMAAELRHSGSLAAAFAKLPHYFTPFQAFVLERAETDNARFTVEQATHILEREANYRSKSPSPAGLLVYELETIARNRLGYSNGLKAMERDGFFDDGWREFIALVRAQLDVREFAELIFARSQHYVSQRRRAEPGYEPPFRVLFGEKEGTIAAANRGKDPTYFFATLQRQLGYPEVPRAAGRDTIGERLAEIDAALKALATRVNLLDAAMGGNVDFSQFTVQNARGPT